MKKNTFIFFLLTILLVFLFAPIYFVHTQEEVNIVATNEYYRATILEILEEEKYYLEEQEVNYQKLKVKILNGSEKDKELVIENGKDFIIQNNQNFKIGDNIVLNKALESVSDGEDSSLYYIIDRYRLPAIIILTVLFSILTIYFGRQRGFTSIVGMAFSILIIFYYIIPQILSGAEPFITSIKGAFIIMIISLYISHGFNKRTSLALTSSLIVLVLAIIVDWLFVHFAKLDGTGSEEAFYLMLGNVTFNLKGLLLGGIIIGILGVLDDVTTAQTATVEEISKANNNLAFKELYQRGISVGREHIASMVNTLLLAYTGASFPLLLLYSSKQLSQPTWLILNNGFIAEEIIRTLVGSVILVIAVPLTTLLAAYIYSRKKLDT